MVVLQSTEKELNESFLMVAVSVNVPQGDQVQIPIALLKH